MIYAEDGEFSKYTYTLWDEYICKLGEHMKFTASGTSCGNKYPYVSWHTNLKWFDKKGNPQSFINNSYYSAYFTFTTTDENMYLLNCYDQVLVDVNGFKGPNTIGKDIYFFSLKSNTNQPYYGTNLYVPGCHDNNYTKQVHITNNNYKEDCKSGTGWGCSRMVINNEI